MAGRFRSFTLMIAAFLLLLPVAVLAEQAAPQGFDGFSDWLAVLLSLVVVLAVVFAVAWGMRRMQGLAGMRNAHMKVIAQMALSTRERLVIVEVGGEQILLGVGPGVIRKLHKLEDPINTEDDAGGASFRDRLMESLGRRGERE